MDLIKFMFHETSMIIPLANGIFDGKLNIESFLNLSKRINLKIKLLKI